MENRAKRWPTNSRPPPRSVYDPNLASCPLLMLPPWKMQFSFTWVCGVEKRASCRDAWPTDQPADTCVNLHTAGCRAGCTRQRSYWDCLFIHSSGVVPRAAASRIAMASEISAFTFRTRDKVTHVTRRCTAAADTDVSPRYFAENQSGVGLCMHLDRSPLFL